jgi:nucleoside-diphosphate-sugar epimerase
MSDTILILGACGQVGTELTEKLQHEYGAQNVVASDIKPSTNPIHSNSQFELLDVLNTQRIAEVFTKHKPTVVYHLAALLSATAEAKPMIAWQINMQGALNVFEACKEHGVKRVFWPSSIAVFGPTTPRINTPQTTILEPNTIYGISKLAGERYCEYYWEKHGLDIRSIRYPGLIGYKSLPGGGTTDYAVEIFYEALKNKSYTSFLNERTALPMMHTEDAIRATIEITNAPAEWVKVRSSYNISGVSFTPQDLADEIKKHIPDFEINYQPDFRQQIADSWPASIDDSIARQDWNWKEEYNLVKLVDNMLNNIVLTS